MSESYSYVQDGLFNKLASDYQYFEKFIEERYTAIFQYYNLKVVLDKSFIREVYTLWVRDRVIATERSKSTIVEPDHFKDAGILTYWLKRISPVSTIVLPEDNKELQNVFATLSHEARENLPDFVWITAGDRFMDQTEDASDTEAAEAERTEDFFSDIILQYPREFPAFRVPFNIVRVIEAAAEANSPREAGELDVPKSFVRDFSILLREKHTSPYSISFIYRSIFLSI